MIQEGAEVIEEVVTALTWWFWTIVPAFVLLVAMRLFFKFLDVVRGD